MDATLNTAFARSLIWAKLGCTICGNTKEEATGFTRDGAIAIRRAVAKTRRVGRGRAASDV